MVFFIQLHVQEAIISPRPLRFDPIGLAGVDTLLAGRLGHQIGEQVLEIGGAGATGQPIERIGQSISDLPLPEGECPQGALELGLALSDSTLQLDHPTIELSTLRIVGREDQQLALTDLGRVAEPLGTTGRLDRGQLQSGAVELGIETSLLEAVSVLDELHLQGTDRDQIVGLQGSALQNGNIVVRGNVLPGVRSCYARG